MTRTIVMILLLGTLASCGGARFAGFDNCSADGSVVWLEYPNSKGTFEGLNNSPCKKPV